MQGEGKGRKTPSSKASGKCHKGLLSPRYVENFSKLKYAKLFRVLM